MPWHAPVPAPAPATYVWNTRVLYIKLYGWCDPESGLHAYYASVRDVRTGMPLVVESQVQLVDKVASLLSAWTHGRASAVVPGLMDEPLT